MRSLKTQYFIAFAVVGSLMPFVPEYLRREGLDRAQIGWVFAVASFSALLTPVLVALLADTHVQPRRLMLAIFALSGVALAAMAPVDGFWPLLILFTAYSLVFTPAMSLQDGLNFRAQLDRQRIGLAPVPYHRIRVWGTIGYILPSVLIYLALLWYTQSHQVILLSAVFFCACGAINAMSLPHTDRAAAPPNAGLPTFAALRAMAEPHVLVFFVAILLLQMAAAAYYSFYPLHLTERVGIDAKWIGLIANLGVGVEIFFMLGFGWLDRKIGLKWIMSLGLAAWAVRLALLGWSDSIYVAIGTQAMHGFTTLVLHVAPPVYLNRRAGDRYRNSMQGIYAMGVIGVGRIVGNAAAGHIAQVSLATMFFYACGLCAIASALLFFAFHDKEHAAKAP